MKVLVGAATGGLGRRVAAALARLPQCTGVRGMVRQLEPDDPSQRQVLDGLRAAGVELVQGDLMQPDTLERAVGGVDVIVSCVMAPDNVMVEGQTNLLNAAKAAGVKKFVASTFSMDLFNIDPEQNPIVAARRRFADILKDSGVPYLHINVGAFTEVFWGFLGLFDRETGVLSYYGSDQQKLDVTTYDTAAEYTARAAVDPELTGVFEVAGDQVSIAEVAAAWKEVHGRELPLRRLGSIDDLRAELERRRQADPANWASYVPLNYQLTMFHGSAKLRHVANDRCPDVQPVTMRAFLRSNPDIAQAAWLPWERKFSKPA